MATAQWVWIFAVLYCCHCVVQGVRGLRSGETSSRGPDTGRRLPLWPFLLATTVTSFSAWTYVGHPGMIAFEGLGYAFASFFVITVPITATFFAKRLWLLGRRYRLVTPGDLYSRYYGDRHGWGEAIRSLIALIAFLFSVAYLAVQLAAAGSVLHVITGVPAALGGILLAAIVLLGAAAGRYVGAAGGRGATWPAAIHAGLLWAGIIVIGAAVLGHFGGWDAFMTRVDGLGPDFLEVPGAWDPPAGEKWTGMFQLTYMMALMGIMASPAFHMWTFAAEDPRPFPWRQVFVSTLFIGAALFLFGTVQGLGGRLLHLDGVIDVTSDAEVTPGIIGSPLIGGPLAGLIVIGALAAMRSAGGAYVGAGGTILVRDLYVRFLRPGAGPTERTWAGRLFMLVIVSAAMAVAYTGQHALVMLGGLAAALGFLLYIPLVDVLYLRRFTAPAVAFALAAAIAAVIVTFAVEDIRYPLNLHSAGWGGLVGFAVAGLVTLVTRRADRARPGGAGSARVMGEMGAWLRDVDASTAAERTWRRAMWVAAPVWFAFAIGPGNVVGNGFVSIAGMPPAWSWQIVWWLLGFGMMWALAFKAGLSRTTPVQIEKAPP